MMSALSVFPVAVAGQHRSAEGKLRADVRGFRPQGERVGSKVNGNVAVGRDDGRNAVAEAGADDVLVVGGSHVGGGELVGIVVHIAGLGVEAHCFTSALKINVLVSKGRKSHIIQLLNLVMWSEAAAQNRRSAFVQPVPW